MEGRGVYHLEANIIGTAERLAPEAIVNSHNGSSVREVLLQCACRFFSDCTFRYHGKGRCLDLPQTVCFHESFRARVHHSLSHHPPTGREMRSDGSSIELRFHPTAGMTYQFRVNLKDGSHATHLRIAIFPPDSIASHADGSEAEVNRTLNPHD